MIAVFGSIPLLTSAQSSSSSETPWGGLHLVTLDESVCTCGGNSHWILDYKTNSLLMLYYQAGQSIIFSNFNTSATYQLGTYSQSSQPCSIEVYSECVDLENMGTYGMMPGTGTSLTKANSAGKAALFKEYRPAATQGSYITALKNSSRSILKALSF